MSESNPHDEQSDRSPDIADDNASSEAAPGYLAGGGQMLGTTAPAELPITGWPRALRAMQHTDYRRLWSGALVSNIGSWMQNVARDWLVFSLAGGTGKFWLGLNAFAEGVPILLLLPVGGVLADRMNRKTLIIVSNALSAALSIWLALLTVYELLQGWHIVVFTACNAALDAIRVPANQSMMPDLVGSADISNAIALNSMQFNLSRVVGPALGGVILITLGPSWSFSLNAVSFIAVIFAVSMIRSLPPHRRGKESMFASLKHGLGYVRSRRDLMVMLLLVVIGGMLCSPVTKLLPALSEDIFNRGEKGFSTLLSCFGVGAVIGAALLAIRSHKSPTPWRAFPILIALGVCQLLLAWNTSYPVGLVLVGLCGMFFIGTMVRLNTAVLQSTPARVRGRTSSFFVLSFRMGIPLGGLLAGWLAQMYGLRWVLMIFGTVALVLMPLMALGVRKGDVQYEAGDGI